MPYSLLFHAIDNELAITNEARLAMVRCLVEKWGADVRALFKDPDGFQCYPLFVAAAKANQSLVAYFLDECGMSVHMKTPRTKDTVLHYFSRF